MTAAQARANGNICYFLYAYNIIASIYRVSEGGVR